MASAQVRRILACAPNDARNILGLDDSSDGGDGDNDDDELLKKRAKKAYRKLALLVHPDKCDDPDAEKAFVRVSNAYTQLTDPDAGMATTVGGGSQFNYQDANDIFREFMKANPGFQAGFSAGLGENGGGVAGSASFDLNRMFSGNFSFKRASLAVARAKWEEYLSTKSTAARMALRPLGAGAFLIASLYIHAMPWSVVLTVVLGIYFGAKVMLWFLWRWFDWVILAFCAKQTGVTIHPLVAVAVVAAVERYTGMTLFGNAWATLFSSSN